MRLGYTIARRLPAATRHPRVAAPVAITREDFTDRLGLPATASNSEVLATLDTKLAAKRATAKDTSQATSEDEALYQAAFG